MILGESILCGECMIRRESISQFAIIFLNPRHNIQWTLNTEFHRYVMNIAPEAVISLRK